MKSRLEQLAAKDPKRLAVLAARKSREKSRSRRLTCSACGEATYDFRDVADVCEQCLVDLWGAQDVLKGEFDASKKAGLVTVYAPNVAHWLDYPSVATTGGAENMPDDAVFVRKEGPHLTQDRSSARLLQMLFTEVFSGVSKAFPADPTSRVDAEPVIPCDGAVRYSGEHVMFMRLPAEAVKALRDLWSFIQWHSHEAHRQGFAAGHDLLSRMNLGDLTHAGFLEEIADQTARTREQAARSAGGRRRGR